MIHWIKQLTEEYLKNYQETVDDKTE
jgi:hypothetical protein